MDLLDGVDRGQKWREKRNRPGQRRRVVLVLFVCYTGVAPYVTVRTFPSATRTTQISAEHFKKRFERVR